MLTNLAIKQERAGRVLSLEHPHLVQDVGQEHAQASQAVSPTFAWISSWLLHVAHFGFPCSSIH